MTDLQRMSFRAMGTDVELLVDAPASGVVTDALRAARQEVQRLEGLLSRFRPDSALSRLNRRGTAVLDRDTFAVVRMAVEARQATDGLFDPTVHDAVIASGYDRDIEAVRSRDTLATAEAVPAAGGVDLDPATRRVELEPGVRLDLGGIAKGFTADRVSAALADAGPCLVSIGGDLAVSGPRRSGAPWPVGIEDGPTLALSAGGVATSGVDRRRWRRGGRELHHIMDPVTGAPADTDLLRVTVVASTATRAEVLATRLMLEGTERASARARRMDVPAVLVPRSGAVLLTGALTGTANAERRAA